MLSFYPVELERALTRDHPLFVGNFFSLKNMWWRKRRQRQGLVISVAFAWWRLVKNNPLAPGFINEECFLTALTDQVKDAKKILEYFFKIEKKGFNIDGSMKSATIISPRRLPTYIQTAISEIIDSVQYNPGPEPTPSGLTATRVRVRIRHRDRVIERLKESAHSHLLPAVEWLYRQAADITFYYKPAGRLQARDTSVWPIRAIETWPSWLRSELFGTVVDIENAYCQFLISQLEQKYHDNPRRLQLQYPDLIKMDSCKDAFRQYVCCDLLQLPATPDNIKKVKKIIMALANGSNITPGLLAAEGGRSQVARQVWSANPNLPTAQLMIAGERLNKIARQFKNAKKDVCRFKLNLRPTRANQRNVFRLYFDWERSARLKIWQAVGCSGLMLHDGLDGVFTDQDSTALAAQILELTQIRVSAESP